MNSLLQGSELISEAEHIISRMFEHKIAMVCGSTYSGYHLVSAVCTHSYSFLPDVDTRFPIRGLYVRSTVKDHGAITRVDGVRGLGHQERVALIVTQEMDEHDIHEATRALRECGLNVAMCIRHGLS